MRIKRLILKDFGPFKRYNISFVDEDEVCVLLTGKNNEGKSTIINALKLLNAATKVINKTKQEIIIKENYYYKLLQQDTESFLVGRMINDYSKDIAEIIGIFQNNLKISVYLDPSNDIIYADHEGHIPSDVQNIFGFIPPFGPLNENEDIIVKLPYLKASIDTSLAPRHLRNHFCQILSKDDFALVKELISKSWQGIELLDYERDSRQGKIYCYYKENGVEREISWAGQGLQVWFQIITHLVRLRMVSIMILDEPEINLHPEKQNDLIRLLKEYHHGSTLIATHSVELMNNVSVSHIINVQKKDKEPKVKSTEDRVYLNLVRSQIGSNFNLIASQFEDFDIIVFTEDTLDFNIIKQIAIACDIKRQVFNIPIHGFSEFKKSISYKHAYELLIGKDINYAIVLDRDYYPEEYLKSVKTTLESSGIRVVFTPGKEIENFFLSSKLLNSLIPKRDQEEFLKIWNNMFEECYWDCHGSYITLHKQFLPGKLDVKTITTQYAPIFEKCWNNVYKRHEIIEGKKALSVLRQFYRVKMNQNLNWNILIEGLIKVHKEDINSFAHQVFYLAELEKQVLHY